MTDAGKPIRFGEVEVDPSLFQLMVAGDVRTLEPKAFRLLLFLIENRERVVTKEEILAAIWPDTFVTDNVLTRAIAQIRRALGDDSKTPRFIETVPTVGYRFVGQPTVELDVPQDRLPQFPPPPGDKKAGLHWWRWVAIAGVLAMVVAGGLFWYGRRQPAGAQAQLVGSSQATSSDGLDIGATFSPDGNLIVYASDRTGPFEIYMKSLDAGVRELQLTSNGQQNMYPCFSRDGKWVYYSAGTSDGVFRVPALGGAAQRITDFGARPSPSPDGKWIAFLSHAPPSLSSTDYYWPSNEVLWLVTSEGGQPKQLAGPGKTGGQTFPAWTEDSRAIRFVQTNYGKYSLWSYRLAEGTFQQHFQVSYAFGSIAFTRDSRRMYFISWAPNGNYAIRRLELDPKTLQAVGNPVTLYRPSIGGPRDLALSPDGKRVLYSSVLSESKLLVANMKGDEIDAASAAPVTHEVTYRYSEPHWSHDGKRIVFMSSPRGLRPQSWIASADGNGVPVQTPPSGLAQYHPHFFPGDESLFLIERLPNEETPHMLLKRADLKDNRSRLLFDVPDVYQPTLAPDGSAIVYHSQLNSAPRLWRLDLSSGEKTPLTSGESPAGYARFSHDGRRLNAEFLRPGHAQLFVMPSRGGKAEIVLDKPGIWYSGGWTVTDDRILSAGNPGNGWGIYSISIRTHDLHPVSKPFPLRSYVRYPELSPDGKRMVYEYNEVKGNVYVGQLP